jgi:type I restriction enzyme S subunit
MKQGWEIKKLGKVLKIQNGYAFNSKLFTIEEGTPLIRIRDIKNGIKTVTNFSGGYDKKYEVNAGDFLIGMDGEFGCYEWTGKTALLNQRVCRLQDFGDKIYSRFLFYGINKFLKDIEDVTAFATVKHISSRQIENIEFPFPSFEEQQRIVAILDEAFAAIAKAKANAEQNLKNAKELFESYLQGVFETKGEGWEEKELGDIVDFFNGFAFKSKDVIEASNTQLIRMGNLYQNQLNLERRAVFYPDDFALAYKKYLLEENDLIISLTGTTDKEDYGYTVRIPKISIKNEKATNKDYLFHFLLSRTFLDKLYKTANGTRQANLSTETMKGLPITIPNMKLQQVIVQKLDALSAETKKLEAIYQQKITDLEELKKSVLQKAFAGELKEKAVLL